MHKEIFMLKVLENFSLLSMLRLSSPLNFSDLVHLTPLIIYITEVIYVLLMMKHEIHPRLPSVFKVGVIFK
jgi:hypothetical protein